LEVRQRGNEYPVLISSEGVPELHQNELVEDPAGNFSLRIGGATTLSKMESVMREIIMGSKGSPVDRNFLARKAFLSTSFLFHILYIFFFRTRNVNSSVNMRNAGVVRRKADQKRSC
jgi:hypothetical protein